MVKAGPIIYRGYYYDTETQLYYCQQRYYNPSWGRWVSADEMFLLDNVNGTNLYIYCLNDCINRIDENGEKSRKNLNAVSPSIIEYMNNCILGRETSDIGINSIDLLRMKRFELGYEDEETKYKEVNIFGDSYGYIIINYDKTKNPEGGTLYIFVRNNDFIMFRAPRPAGAARPQYRAYSNVSLLSPIINAIDEIAGKAIWVLVDSAALILGAIGESSQDRGNSMSREQRLLQYGTDSFTTIAVTKLGFDFVDLGKLYKTITEFWDKYFKNGKHEQII
jgi:RHS repeat-associated protein